MNKFGRNYIATITDPTGLMKQIPLPFTMEFDITRNIMSSANIAQFRFYNLSEATRNQIRVDFYDLSFKKHIEVKAGYQNQLSIIFSGYISQAWSVRESVDFITQIESFDGGEAFADGTFNEAFSATNAAPKDVMAAVIDRGLPGVTRGVIGKNFDVKPSRGNSYGGNSIDILREISGKAFFIDNGIANILGSDECLQGEIEVINSQSGLLGTPIRENTIVTFDMIFEPRLKAGQLIQLDSLTGANFNGPYKVISVKHRGMISEAVCGEAITTVGLLNGKALGVVTNG